MSDPIRAQLTDSGRVPLGNTDHPRSRERPVALLVWGALATMALAYLGLLATRPELATRIAGSPSHTSGGSAAVGAVLSLKAEIGELHRVIDGLKTEIVDLRGKITGVELNELTLKAQLGQLEAAMRSGLATSVPASAPLPAIDPASRTPGTTGSIDERPAGNNAWSTTSLPPKSDTKPAGPATATASQAGPGLLIATGPSLDALRLSWQLLQERHPSVLKGLEPRYVASSDPEPTYRLIAGPFPGAREAERGCARARAQRLKCQVAAFQGDPL